MLHKIFHKKKDKHKNKEDQDHSNKNDGNDNHGSLNSANPTPSYNEDIQKNGNHKNNKNKTKNNNIADHGSLNNKTNHHSSISKDDISVDELSSNKKKQELRGLKKRHSHQIGSVHPIKERRKDLDLPTNKDAMGMMMGSAVTNQRLQQLMEMRGGGKDAKDRSRSMNARKQKKEINNKYPKKRRSEIHKEPRRHSMFPDKEGSKNNHEKHLKDRRKTAEKKVTNKRVQYRVKNEIFVLYDYYQPVRIIGSGAYAVVCEAINTITGKKVAIKKNKGVFDHITDARRILREIKLMMHFNQQDIISLYDVIPPEHHELDTFNDVYLIMPKMETTLAKVIRSKQKLTDRHFQFFMYQLLRGLFYMHSANVIHRDLKPENILINGADCNVKITDFGLARGVCKDDNIEKPTEYVVTRWYRSPEVMCSAGFYDEKVDIWSLGCIFAELILRRPLFPGQNYLDQLKIIFDIMGTPKQLDWIKTPEAKRWVQKLKPHDGKPFNEVFNKASNEALDLLKDMLCMDPNNRKSSKECIRHKYLKELYRKEDEQTCPHFDLNFEFEQSIKTKFGVRHMMNDALSSFSKKHIPKKKFKKKNSDAVDDKIDEKSNE